MKLERQERGVAAGVALQSGGRDPKISRLHICLRAAAEGVHRAEHDARASVALKSGFLEPREGSSLVVRDAFRVEIQIGEVVLSLWVTAFGSLAVPGGSYSVILNDAEAAIVHVAQIHFRSGVAAA